MIYLKSLISEQKSSWINPSLEGSMDSIENISEDLFINPEVIIDSFPNGSLMYLNKNILDNLQNTDFRKVNSYLNLVEYIQKNQKSNPEYKRDWISIKNALKNKSPIEAPVIMKYKRNYHLLDGNIRLMVSKISGIPPHGYVFHV